MYSTVNSARFMSPYLTFTQRFQSILCKNIPHFNMQNSRPNFVNLINFAHVSTSSNSEAVTRAVAHRQELEDEVVPTPRRKKRIKDRILKMPAWELQGTAVGLKKLSLPERRGEWQSVYKHLVNNVDKTSYPAFFRLIQSDINLRPTAIRRWIKSINVEMEILNQEYNPQRNSVLGNDLAAAHFVVYRNGKIRFKGHSEWVTEYKRDPSLSKMKAKKGEDDEDSEHLSPLQQMVNLPTSFDPNYRVEALDLQKIPIRYEGLLNIASIHYVKWLSFRECPHFDDWCIDRVLCNFGETLEYLDISGCPRITERGLCALSRAMNLQVLIVENMNIKNLEIVCAQLEDIRPNLTVIGVDYERKLQELKEENLAAEQKAKDVEALEKEKLEKMTISVESREDALTKPLFEERLDKIV